MDTDCSRREALAAMSALGLAAIPALAGQPDRQPTSPLPPGSPPSLSPLKPEQLGWDPARREFTLPPLGYPVEALEPHIDKETMTIHREKHHAAYVTGANNALKKLAEIRDNQGDVSLIKHWSRELAFHVSGHMNHCLFWASMAPAGSGGGGAPPSGSELLIAMLREFGSYEKFVAHFKTAAQQVEGGGWAWLVFHRDTDMLMVMQAEKQQNMAVGGFIPLLGLDVWEHAYYLKYKADRKAYIDAFFNVVAWPRIVEFYQRARK